MDIAKQSTTKIIFAVRGNLLTALLLSKVSFHLKPERLHFDVTGGEALEQNIASSLTRSCLEGSTPASHGTALQAAGSKLHADSEGFAPGF